MLSEFLSTTVTPPGSAIVIQANTLQALLWEIYGGGPVGASTGQTFPAGSAASMRNAGAWGVDVTSLNSPAGGTPTLKTFAMPAAALNATTGSRGIRIRGSGSFANNGNAKTVLCKFGATTILTVTGTASTANVWHIDCTVWVRTATTQICNGLGAQGPGTPTFVAGNATAAETLSGAITVSFTGTQTSAADIIQDTMIVELLP